MKYIFSDGNFCALTKGTMIAQMEEWYLLETLTEDYFNHELQETLPKGTQVFECDGIKQPLEEEIMLNYIEWKKQTYTREQVMAAIDQMKAEDEFYEFKRNIRIGQRF